MVEDASGENIRVMNLTEDMDRQFLKIVLGTFLNPGFNYTLSMKFIGELNDQHRGFFRISYNEDSQKKYVAATQMEPVDGRR